MHKSCSIFDTIVVWTIKIPVIIASRAARHNEGLLFIFDLFMCSKDRLVQAPKHLTPRGPASLRPFFPILLPVPFFVYPK